MPITPNGPQSMVAKFNANSHFNFRSFTSLQSFMALAHNDDNLPLPANVGAVDTIAFSPNLDRDKTFFVGTKFSLFARDIKIETYVQIVLPVKHFDYGSCNLIDYILSRVTAEISYYREISSPANVPCFLGCFYMSVFSRMFHVPYVMSVFLEYYFPYLTTSVSLL